MRSLGRQTPARFLLVVPVSLANFPLLLRPFETIVNGTDLQGMLRKDLELQVERRARGPIPGVELPSRRTRSSRSLALQCFRSSRGDPLAVLPYTV